MRNITHLKHNVVLYFSLRFWESASVTCGDPWYICSRRYTDRNTTLTTTAAATADPGWSWILGIGVLWCSSSLLNSSVYQCHQLTNHIYFHLKEILYWPTQQMPLKSVIYNEDGLIICIILQISSRKNKKN